MWVQRRGSGTLVSSPGFCHVLTVSLLQCKLFHSIKPLFTGKPVLLVINKIDVMRLDDLPQETRALVDEIINSEGVTTVQVSCYSEEGVMEVKNKACDALLAHRVENKLKGSKINSVINKIHVAQPKPRDDIVRAPFIPESVKEKKKHDKTDPERKRLLRDIEAEEGGAGVYNLNMKGTTCSLLRLYAHRADLVSSDRKLHSCQP